MERMKGIAPHSQCESAARLGDDIVRARHFGVRAITPGRGDTESVRCRLIRPFDSLHSALKNVRKNTPRCAGCCMERMKGIAPHSQCESAARLGDDIFRARHFGVRAITPGRGDTESVRCRLIRPFDSLHSVLKNAKKHPAWCGVLYGANEGNRTLDRSLGSCCFTIKLHSHSVRALFYHNGAVCQLYARLSGVNSKSVPISVAFFVRLDYNLPNFII